MKSVISWQRISITTATTTYYAVYGTPSSTTEADVSIPISVAGTLRNLRVYRTTAAGSGKSHTFTVYKNGVAQSLAVTTADAATTGSDLSNSVTYAAGDTLSLGISASGTPTSSVVTIFGEFTSTTANEQPIFGIDSGFRTTTLEYGNLGTANGNAYTTENAHQTIVPTGGTISHLYVKATAAQGVGKSTTVTVRQNEADTALLKQLANATTGNDTTHSFSVAAGDRINVSVSPSGTPAAANYGYCVKFTPTTAGESIYAATDNGTISGDTYEAIGYGTSASSQANAITYFPTGTVSKLYSNFTVAPGAGKSWDTYMRLNGSSTSLVSLIADANTTGNDTTHTVSVTVGDYINFFFDRVSTATASLPRAGFVWNGTSAIKTIMGLAVASVKTVDGLAIASVKTVDGLS